MTITNTVLAHINKNSIDKITKITAHSGQKQTKFEIVYLFHIVD